MPNINPNMAPPPNFWDGDKFKIGAPGLQAGGQPQQPSPQQPAPQVGPPQMQGGPGANPFMAQLAQMGGQPNYLQLFGGFNPLMGQHP